MTPRDALGVLIRAGGVTCLILGMFDLLGVLALAIGLPMAPGHEVPRMLTGAALYGAGGIAVLIAAGPLTRLRYRGD